MKFKPTKRYNLITALEEHREGDSSAALQRSVRQCQRDRASHGTPPKGANSFARETSQDRVAPELPDQIPKNSKEGRKGYDEDERKWNWMKTEEVKKEMLRISLACLTSQHGKGKENITRGED
ncbi:hypothetical protein RUM44_012115 [Polyplax serrata]|uniref:Uncharacterized protein n=1 Tax=Polyplax serrata TaxID=468196 RepID=A0ABR1BAD4_POLSC